MILPFYAGYSSADFVALSSKKNSPHKTDCLFIANAYY